MNSSHGCIYARARSPFWWYKFKDPITGKRKSGSTGVRRRGSNGGKKEARDFLNALRGDAKRGISTEADKVFLVDLERLVVARLELNRKTSVDRAKRAYWHLKERIGGTPALFLPSVLDEYVTARLKEAKPATVRQELRWLGRGYRLASEKGMLPYRPALPAIEVDNARQGFATTEQIDALIARLPEYMRAPTRWAFVTGWRKSEVFGLTWARVDIANGTARLESTETKTRKAREFPYHVMPELAEVIAERRAATTAWERAHGTICPWVFHHDGKPIIDFRTVWFSARKAAALDLARKEQDPGMLTTLTFHDLRRSAIRQMELAGVPRSTAMKLSGHRTEAIYTRYAITAQADLEAGVAKIAALPAGRVKRSG